MPLLIVDYGVGNLGSLGRAFRRLGVPYQLSSDPQTVRRGTKLVLPGVGHFGESMVNLRARGLESPLKEAVSSGASLLGICVGFQMLFEESEEAPGVAGLGLLRGRARRFPAGSPVPHVGWNQIDVTGSPEFLEGVRSGDYFYFLHSYYVCPEEKAIVQARTEYGIEFCSVASRDRISAIQFHPEKSQQLGLRVLRNFCLLP